MESCIRAPSHGTPGQIAGGAGEEMEAGGYRGKGVLMVGRARGKGHRFMDGL